MRKPSYSSNPIEVASRTYILCANALAEKLGVEPVKGLKPKATYFATVELCIAAQTRRMPKRR
jgi:hypothetical protein